MLTMCAVARAFRFWRHDLIRGTMSGLLALSLFGASTGETRADVASSSPGHEPVSQTALFAPGPLHPSPSASETAELHPDDADRYRRIFELQEAGRWAEADRLIRAVGNRVLMGHVLAQRYLHPTAWKSSFAELRDWLALYHDHPQAASIHSLATKRRPAGASKPHAPTTVRLQFRGDIESFGFTPPKLPKNGKADIARAERAARVFYEGKDDEALKLAKASIASSGCAAPRACWIAGLASWRLGDYAEAGRHFEALAESEWADPWTRAAGGFWGARASLRAGVPERVVPLMAAAARYPRTFYGLLAARTLGDDATFAFEPPTLTEDGIAALLAKPAGRRALALLRVGRTEALEDELRQLNPRDNPTLAEAVIALVEQARLPNLALEIGSMLKTPDGGIYDAALYPLPAWEPTGGFRVDRALLYAIMRQESRFAVAARSSAGATGLMQLMPGTAAAMASRIGLPRSAAAYRNPEHNIALGQHYIEMLLANPVIDGNLFLLAAAYNGGPGNLAKWRKRVDDQGDPLLFIETVPAMETRSFIERVLANYWVYRLRLGQDVPSLDALAEGEWPIYRPVDPDVRQTAELAAARR